MAETPTLPPEDKARVDRMMREIFTPHLQQAMKEAREKAPLPELLSASSIAFASMLIQLVGERSAADLLRGLAANVDGSARPAGAEGSRPN